MRLSNPLYGLYERRLLQRLDPHAVPQHVGVMLDGNRRWARQVGEDPAHGHQVGADKIAHLLDWCEEVGVNVVTLYMLSTGNLTRPERELSPLIDIIERAVTDLANQARWRIQPIGALDLLPPATATLLNDIADQTKDAQGVHVNVAIGYGGRQEITDAVRSLLHERAARGQNLTTVAQSLTAEDIAAHLYTRGQPDPDLVIRTSGEQRISGFLLWQSADSEFYFCEAYWPAFRKVDFLRALRSFASRERRFGS